MAIRGMVETLPGTQTLCVCCHDFLAEFCSDDLLRTRNVVIEFLPRPGLRVGRMRSRRSAIRPRAGLGVPRASAGHSVVILEA
jgi:hypothetical protein